MYVNNAVYGLWVRNKDLLLSLLYKYNIEVHVHADSQPKRRVAFREEKVDTTKNTVDYAYPPTYTT